MCKGGSKTVLVKVLEKKQSGRTKIPIDKCMAPLIRELNKFGFETVSSCCCGHGHIGHLHLKFGDVIKNTLIKKNTLSIEFQLKK